MDMCIKFSHRPRSNITAFPTCLWISFRFAYANGGDESLPPAQCKIKTEISVLLYPTTLITRFIPAFFTEGYQQGSNSPWITPSRYVADSIANAPAISNKIGISTEDGKKVSILDEDTSPNDSGIKSKKKVRKIQSWILHLLRISPLVLFENSLIFPDYSYFANQLAKLKTT